VEVDDQFDVFVVGVDGSSPTNLTSNPADDFAPVWIEY
jgi:hypothetical protein